MALTPASNAGTATGSGGSTLIGATVLAAPAASLVVSGIPATYAALHVDLLLRSTRASASDRTIVQLNADATVAHYMTDEVLNNKGSATFAQVSTAAGFDFDGVGASATAGVFSGISLDLVGYSTTASMTVMNGLVSFFDGTGIIQYTNGGLWLVTTIVTSITVLPTTGPNWAAGSMIAVYGRAAS